MTPAPPTCRSPGRADHGGDAGAAGRLGADLAGARATRARRPTTPTPSGSRTSTAAGVDHDHIIAGIYHNGTGAGRSRTSAATRSRPPSVLDERRGAVPARLLQLAVLQRQRGREARPTLDRRRLPAERHRAAQRQHREHRRQRRRRARQRRRRRSRPGFTYVATTAGPPTRDRTRERPDAHLGGGLGDIAGGATAVTFQVSVDASVSAHARQQAFGQFQRDLTATTSARASPPTSAAT